MADDRSKSKNIVNHLQNITDVPENRIRTAIEAIDGESDIPENRIQAVIEAIDVESGGEDSGTVPLSQSPSTDASPRPSRPRRLGVDDISYLSDREFARVLGLTLEQFDGNTVRPPATETIEVDLLWNRAQIALGIRTVTATKGEVGENHVTPLLEGNTTSDVTRAPSYLAVVTNGTFSDQAEQIAENNDIGLFDGGHLEQWFRRVLIPFDAVGTVLEESEGHDGPLDELVTFPTPPEPRCGINPLELERVSEMQTETTDERVGITREELLEQLRSLHDRLDRLPETGDLQNISGIHQNDYVGNFGSWDEALKTAGIDKEQVLLDDIERVAEKVGGVPSAVDMDEHGTYSADYYQSCFGSWSTALEQSVVRETYDSGSDDGDSGSDSNDREAMLETIRELHEQLGHVPKTTELPEEYTPNHFYDEFGDWDTALEAAGIDKEQAILDEIERVAQKVERVPTTTDIQEHDSYPASAYQSYFDSWNEALEQSGVKQRFEEKSESQESRSREISEESETQKEMLKILQLLHDDLDRIPEPNDLPEESGYARHEFYSEFGSWDEALEAADIDKEQALLDEIERVAQKVGRVPTSTDMDDHGTFPYANYTSYFESWDAALKQSGVDQSKLKLEMIDTLQSLHDGLDRVPKSTELPEDCEYSQHDFYSKFGSWDKALEAAGINKEKALLDEIQRVAEEIGRVPSTVDMQEYGSNRGYSLYFGSWDEALKAAGINKEQALVDEIQRIAEELGRVPNYAEMSEYGDYSGATYTNYFGSWSNVLEQSGVKESYNSGSDNPNQKSATSTDEAEITATEGSCNQDKILTEIAKVQRIVHREPTRDDFKTNANIPISAVDEQFDSWKTAVNAAMASEQKHDTSSEGTITGTDSTDPTATEIPRNYSGRTEKSQYTPEGVLDEIRKVAVKLGRTPLIFDMQEHANISIDTVREIFDTWARARKEAGVDEITEARLSELRESYNSGPSRGISDVTSEESGDGALLPPDTSVDEIDDYVAGVGPTSIYAIKKAGYKTLGELHDATLEEVTECKGIGRAKAAKVIQFVTENVSALQDDRSVPVDDEQSSPGKKGVLYSDPDEDGDYQMLDNYLKEL